MKLDKIKNTIIKIVLIVSFPFLTFILGYRYNKIDIIISCILSLLISSYWIIKKLKIKKIDSKNLIISTLLSFEMISNFIKNSYTNTVFIQDICFKYLNKIPTESSILKIFGLLSIPAVTLISYLFIKYILPKVIKFFKNLSKTEKIYIGITTLIVIPLVIVLTQKTNAFSMPTHNNEIVNYDVVYTTDSGSLTRNNVYYTIAHDENDIRQPLFGLFSLPFAVVATFLGKLCFFLRTGYEEKIIMTIIQFIILSITNILLSRLLKLKDKEKIPLFLLFSLNFTYIVFGLVLEQYVFALFYLILTIYYYLNNEKKTNYFYLGAVSTLLTSGILFPIITKIKDHKKEYIKSVSILLGIFISILIVSGQLPIFIHMKERLEFLSKFTKDITFNDRIYQFTHFIKGIFIANPGNIIYNKGIPSYWLLEYTKVSIIGIILFIGTTISLILNKDKKIVKIAYLWIVFSILILGIVGWGLQENGLILYNLYFAWAYIILIYCLIRKLIKNKKVQMITVYSLSIILFIINLPELIKLLLFAIKYY